MALDEIIKITDTIILAQGGTICLDSFRNEFKLSDNSTFMKYQPSSSSLSAQLPQQQGKIHILERPPIFFGNRFILNWTLLCAPRNILWKRTFLNVIDILWDEYLRLSQQVSSRQAEGHAQGDQDD